MQTVLRIASPSNLSNGPTFIAFDFPLYRIDPQLNFYDLCVSPLLKGLHQTSDLPRVKSHRALIQGGLMLLPNLSSPTCNAILRLGMNQLKASIVPTVPFLTLIFFPRHALPNVEVGVGRK